MKRRPTHVGPEKNCPAKRNGIAPHTELAAEANARIPGERNHRLSGTAILIFSDGSRFPSGRTLRVRATSAWQILLGMAGNGRGRLSHLSRVSSNFRFIPGIPQISSTENIL